MKLLSVAVPCYNSGGYMRHVIESLLPGGEVVVILIVDDGSADDTAKNADDYQRRYPTIGYDSSRFAVSGMTSSDRKN